MTTSSERYFEKEGGRWDQFFAVTVEGDTLHLRKGDVTKFGSLTPKRFASPALAQQALTALIATKKKEGYEEKKGPAIYVDGQGKYRGHFRAALNEKAPFLCGYACPLDRIDLTPLAQLTRLEEFDLNQHSFSAIDLAPLAKVKTLKSVSISSNKKLKSLDLTPLRACPKLTHLSLHTLKSFDPKQLGEGFTKLKYLALQLCNFTTLDLTPLASLTSLEYLDLCGNPKLRTVDVSPLGKLKRLATIELDPKCKVTGTCRASIEQG